MSHHQERADLWWRRQCLFNECPYVTVFLCVCVEASGPKVVSSWILAADSHCHVLLQHYLPISCKCQVQLSTHSTCTLSGRCFCSTSKIKKKCHISLFSEFFQDKYGYSKREGAFIVGAVYDVSVVFTSVFGILIVSIFVVHFIGVDRK